MYQLYLLMCAPYLQRRSQWINIVLYCIVLYCIVLIAITTWWPIGSVVSAFSMCMRPCPEILRTNRYMERLICSCSGTRTHTRTHGDSKTYYRRRDNFYASSTRTRIRTKGDIAYGISFFCQHWVLYILAPVWKFGVIQECVYSRKFRLAIHTWY